MGIVFALLLAIVSPTAALTPGESPRPPLVLLPTKVGELSGTDHGASVSVTFTSHAAPILYEREIECVWWTAKLKAVGRAHVALDPIPPGESRTVDLRRPDLPDDAGPTKPWCRLVP